MGGLILSSITSFALWVFLPDSIDQIPLLPVSDAYHLGFGLLLLAVQFVLACINLLRSGLSRAIAGVIFLLLLFQLRWLQLYTGIGILVLNGDNHWVSKAASSSDARRASEYLGIVLRSTSYGANQAENEVLDYPLEDQRRLFRLLASQTSNKYWKQQFERRAQDADAGSRPRR